MTRFARHGDGRKRPLQASSWTDLKGANKEISSARENGSGKHMQKVRDRNSRDKITKRKQHLPYKNSGKVVMKCYKCQKIGHKAVECSEQKTDQETVCYNCHQNGHKAFNCPQNPQAIKEEWKKVKRSEFRRQKRQIQVQSQKVGLTYLSVTIKECKSVGYQYMMRISTSLLWSSPILQYQC